jgi:hypothetical protein
VKGGVEASDLPGLRKGLAGERNDPQRGRIVQRREDRGALYMVIYVFGYLV